MSERPGSFALAKESMEFVFSNMGVLIDQIKLLFPLMLILSLADIIAEVYKVNYVTIPTAIFSLYLYACLALAWHRYSLSGAQPSRPINPFAMDREDFKFIGLFFVVAILPILMGAAIGAIMGGAQVAGGGVAIAIAALIAIPLFFYAFLQFLRFSFKLPAKSLGVDLSFAEAKRASRGMISRILLSGFFVGAGTGVVLLIYSLLAGISVGFASSGEEPGEVAKIVMGFLLGAPVLFVFLVVIVINVTVLSKAYQWGIQNNAIDTAN